MSNTKTQTPEFAMPFRYKDIDYRHKAIKELLSDGKTLKEIADELGYSSASAVANAMKLFGLKTTRRK